MLVEYLGWGVFLLMSRRTAPDQRADTPATDQAKKEHLSSNLPKLILYINLTYHFICTFREITFTIR